MNFLKGLVVFIGGAAVGAGVTYVVVSKKVNQRADDEIAELREYYENRKIPDLTVKEENKEDHAEEPVVEIKTQITRTVPLVKVPDREIAEDDEHIDYHAMFEQNKIDKTTLGASPFEYLTDVEFVQSDRDKISLDYYEGDGVLVNVDEADTNDPYEDIESTIGRDALKHFGDYEFDFVFVRNNRLSVDFEVCRHRECWATNANGPVEEEGPLDG